MTTLLVLLQAATAEAVAREVHARFVEGQWEETLAAYRKMPDPPREKDPDDRFHRSAAHWEAAHAHARLGRWEEARQAFADARTRWRRPSFCGNAIAAYNVEGALAEGVCLERLGRPHEALELYFGTLGSAVLCRVERPASRIVELHAAANALDALESRMARMDQAFWKKIAETVDDPEKRLALMSRAPAASLRPFYEAARAAGGAWRPSRESPAVELPFPPIPKGFRLP